MNQTAKIFMNGRSQAVRLPAEFRFEGSEVNIRRDADTGDVILSPKPQRTGSWDRFFASLDGLSEADIPAEFLVQRFPGVQLRDDPFANEELE